MKTVEEDYRQQAVAFLGRLEEAFSQWDSVELEHVQGVLTILFPDQSRCILSLQPFLRQIWLAMSATSTAYHFTYDRSLQAWVDDQGIELIQLIKNYCLEQWRFTLVI